MHQEKSIIYADKLTWWSLPFAFIHMVAGLILAGFLYRLLFQNDLSGILTIPFAWFIFRYLHSVLFRLMDIFSATGAYAELQAYNSMTASLYIVMPLLIAIRFGFYFLDEPVTEEMGKTGLALLFFGWIMLYTTEQSVRLRLLKQYPLLVDYFQYAFWPAIWTRLLGRHKHLHQMSPADQLDEARFYPARQPGHDFSAVHGMNELKQQLRQTVSTFLKEDGNGILLYGPPGNGKTFIAEALAGELGWNFLDASLGTIKSRWVNQTGENIIALFASARQQAPVVLFLDELDALLTDRSNRMHNEDKKAVNAFLTELSAINKGFSQHRVLVMGATNLIEQLDPAALREKRFDAKILVPNPDYEARLGIIIGRLDKAGVRYDRDTLTALIRRWEGFSAARCFALAEALERHWRKHQQPLDYDTIIHILKQVQGTTGQLDHVPDLDALALTPQVNEQVQLIIKMLSRPDAVESLGIRPAKGAIFFGPPGTGKTLLAKALAKTLNWSFMQISGAELLRGELTPGELIERAISVKPVIVLIDEGDDLIRSRKFGGGSNAMLELLSKMEGDPRLMDVFFIATTNMHPDELDSAMIRDGRFEYLLDFTPDLDTLVATAEFILKQRHERNRQLRWQGDLRAYIACALEHLKPAQIEPTQSYIVGLIDDLLMDAYNRQGKQLALDFDFLLEQCRQAAADS